MSKSIRIDLLPEGFIGCDADGNYATPHLSDDAANLNALSVLQQFHGIPAPVVRQILRQALFWLDAVTILDCGEASELQRAFEGLRRAAEQSL